MKITIEKDKSAKKIQVRMESEETDETIVVEKTFGLTDLRFDHMKGMNYSTVNMNIDDLFTALMLLEQEELSFIEEEMAKDDTP